MLNFKGAATENVFVFREEYHHACVSQWRNNVLSSHGSLQGSSEEKKKNLIFEVLVFINQF